MKAYSKVVFGFTIILVLSGCASKFAPVVSRPDNLKIDCTSACNFDIPMNTEIIVARNTNGWDFAKVGVVEGLRALPVLGAIGISWQTVNMMEGVFNKVNRDIGNVTTTTTTNTTTTGDSISTTSGDNIATSDSSGSGNSTSSSSSSVVGDTVDSSGSGNEANTTYDNDVEYNNSHNSTQADNNSNQNNL